MKGLNLTTAIYGLVLSIFLLIVPLFTLTAILGEAVDETAKGASSGFDMTIRFLTAVLLVLTVILMIKDRVASTAGKVLLVIGCAIVILFSSLLGFPAGVLGIIGSSLLLASNKKYNV